MESPIRILYIEDDPLDVMAFERKIKEDGLPYILNTAPTIKETGSLMVNEDPFDVIIADYLLEDGNAFEIFNYRYSAPIIFITGAGDEEVAIRAMKKGAYDYIIKDSDRNYLKILPYTIQNSIQQYKDKQRIQLLESSVLNANDTIIIMVPNNDDPFGSEVIFVNKAISKLTGYRPEEVMTNGFQLLIGEDTDQTELARSVERLKKNRPTRNELTFYQKSSRPFWADVTMVPVNDDVSGKCSHYLIIARDITRKKKNERELIEARIVAEEAKRAEEQFLAVMSHEIRTPINSIVGLVDLLSSTKLDGEQIDYVKSVKSSADNLLLLVNDILDMSRIEEGQVNVTTTDFRLDELINNAIKTLKFSADDKGLDLYAIHDVNIPSFIKGDPVRMNQIFTNLLSNAIKYTKEGEVSIRTFIVTQSPQAITIKIRISDTGVGIPHAEQKEIFSKYKQINPNEKRPGTGLGLFIVQELVKHLGGKIEMQSVVGSGTSFTVMIDFEPATQDPMITNPFAKQKSLAGGKVLIGEDNLMNKKIISKMMTKWELEPVFCSNGVAVLNELKKDDSYDLLLLDLRMPELNGYETVRNIRENMGMQIPIVLMTAAPFREEFPDLDSFIDGLLMKPFESSRLYAILTKYLNVSLHPQIPHRKKDPDMPRYDLTFLRKASNNNQEFISEMIEIFINQVEEFTAVADDLMEDENYEDIALKVHTLKSSARNMGNRELFIQCDELEKVIIKKANHVNRVPPMLNDIVEESKATVTALREIEQRS